MDLGPDESLSRFVVVLLFGSAKLPGLELSLGQAQREFRDGFKRAGGPLLRGA